VYCYSDTWLQAFNLRSNFYFVFEVCFMLHNAEDRHCHYWRPQKKTEASDPAIYSLSSGCFCFKTLFLLQVNGFGDRVLIPLFYRSSQYFLHRL
jgi:hypothetical protein